MKPSLILLTALLLAPPLLVSAAEPPKVETSELVVVEKGKPMCAIFMGPGAPKSVRLAADEIQWVIKLATGSSLPVITEARPPMICLGDCAAARAAGLAVEAMADESFQIVTHGHSVFIVGKDTADGRVWNRE